MEMTHCPICGNPHLYTGKAQYPDNGERYQKCHTCGWQSDVDIPYADNKPIEPDHSNPYTNFAKEMSLLHEALKAEGFKNAMVDIMAAMTPEVWRKVQFEEQKDFLHRMLGINVDDFVAKCNDDNKKPRPENWGGGAMT